MNAIVLLNEARTAGIFCTVVNGQVRLTSDHPPTTGLLGRLRANKAEILRALASLPPAITPETFPADDPEAIEERAAIYKLEATVRDWCASIGERDETLIQAVVDQCRHDPAARAGYLRQANPLPAVAADTFPTTCADCRHHEKQNGHPFAGRCAAGQYPGEVLWATDIRWCQSFNSIHN